MNRYFLARVANVSIENVPEDRWIVSDHWQEGGPKNIPEGKTYSRIGAFVKDFEFDWKRWRVPPGTLSQIDLSQQWAVAVSAAALENAGYLGDEAEREIPNSRTGVVFANALGGENRNLSNHRVWADSFARKALVTATFILSSSNGTTLPLRFITLSFPGAVIFKSSDGIDLIASCPETS